MKTKAPTLTPQQKAQILGDKPHQQTIDALFDSFARCAESGPLTIPITAISRKVSVLNAIFERAKSNPRPVGTGIPILIITLN